MLKKLLLLVVAMLCCWGLAGCSEKVQPMPPPAQLQEEQTQAWEEGRAMLEGIHRGVQPGTAGCSLKLLQTTVRTCQWGQHTTLTPEQLHRLRTDYMAALSPEEAQLFSKQLEDVAWEYGNLTDPALVDSNIARLHDVNMSSRDIALPVQRLEAMDALLKQ